LLALAKVALEEAHVTMVVTSWVLPSVKVPVAVNCCVVPAAIDGLDGVTTIDLSAAGVTLSAALPLMELPLSVAMIVAVPALMAVVSP